LESGRASFDLVDLALYFLTDLGKRSAGGMSRSHASRRLERDDVDRSGIELCIVG